MMREMEMKRGKKSFAWVVEEYAFGAVALREEIKRHKAAKGEHWSLLKNVGIRLLYAYAVVGTIVLVGIGLIWQGIQRFKH